jgi:hypothetical protein
MFFKKKEIWVPTWKSWLLFAVVVVVFVYTALHVAVPFLAPTQPLGARVLVIEGWIPEPAIHHAIELNDQNHYALVITAGEPIEKGMDISQYGTYAELMAARLVALGFKGTNLIKAPAPKTRKDRTYHSALAVRDYLMTNTTYRAIDVLSEDVHSRRTWLLYRKACEPEIKVGIIANESPDFDPQRWWKSSQGVRTVMSEAISYLYAKFIFTPN